MAEARLSKSRRHIHVFDEDWDFLQRYYGRQSANQIGASEAIRLIVHKRVVELRQQFNDLADSADSHLDEDASPPDAGGVTDL